MIRISIVICFQVVNLFFGDCFTHPILKSNEPLDTPEPKSPIPYINVREADVMWQKRIWRIIDLKEKLNFPLLYPENEHPYWKSLFTILMEAAKNQTIQPYDVSINGTDEFLKKLSWSELESRLSQTLYESFTRPDPPYEKYDSVYSISLSPVQYKLKEDWFIDKQRSVLDVRIIGLCPLIPSYDKNGEIRGVKPLCWFYFPEIRKVLSTNEVFNRFNDVQRLSFDDVFAKRMFSSYIIKESNVFDRSIFEYCSSKDALMESDRIKDDIFRYEQDLWEY